MVKTREQKRHIQNYRSNTHFKDYFMYICEGLNVCVCTLCVSGVCGGQKKALDPLELKLQVVVSHNLSPQA